jgi:hypothetical protein
MSDDMDEEYGFQSLHTRLPKRLGAKVNELFDTYDRTLASLRKSFKEEVRVQALTLAPKDSFEIRLRCLATLDPEFKPYEEEYHSYKGEYEYSVAGVLHVHCTDCHSFITEDDRYDVIFRDVRWERDLNKRPFQKIHLAVKDQNADDDADNNMDDDNDNDEDDDSDNDDGK